MTTSGTNLWSITENDIIHKSARIVGMIGAGDVLSSTEYVNARQDLNLIIKALISENLGLWRKKDIIYGFDGLTQVLDSDGTNYYSIKPHTATVSTSPSTGNIWQDYWAVGLGEATAESVIGQFYDSSKEQELPAEATDIINLFIRDGNFDRMVKRISWEDYQQTADKNYLTSFPRQFALEEKIGEPKTIHFVGTPNLDTKFRMHISYSTYYDDMDNASQTTDFPSTYQNFLVYELASQLADEVHLELSERSYISSKARSFKDIAFKENFKQVDTQIQGLYDYPRNNVYPRSYDN